MKSEKAARLKKAREILGLTQQQVADSLEIRVSYISDMENGRRTITEKLISKLSTALSISPDWMYTGKGEMMNNGGVAMHPDSDAHLQKEGKKMYPKSVPTLYQLKKGLTAIDLRELVDALADYTNDRKPTRHAGDLTNDQIEFEYRVALEQLKDAYNDLKGLNAAMYKMGPPDFMVEKFAPLADTFNQYLKTIEDDYRLEEKEAPGAKVRVSKLEKVENIYHPQTLWLREQLSKLISYMLQYGDMFDGGENSLRYLLAARAEQAAK